MTGSAAFAATPSLCKFAKSRAACATWTGSFPTPALCAPILMAATRIEPLPQHRTIGQPLLKLLIKHYISSSEPYSSSSRSTKCPALFLEPCILSRLNLDSDSSRLVVDTLPVLLSYRDCVQLQFHRNNLQQLCLFTQDITAMAPDLTSRNASTACSTVSTVTAGVDVE